MWEFECSTETEASRAAVWAIWSDPGRWQEFDPGIVWARAGGSFAAGAEIRLKPRGGPTSTIQIVTCEPERGFSTLARLPLARLRFEHELADSGDGRTRLMSRVRVSGPLGQLYPRIFRLRQTEPELQANLARLAEAAGPSRKG